MDIQMVNGVIEPAETEEDIENESAPTVTVPRQVWADLVEQNQQMQTQIRDLAREQNALQLAWNKSIDTTASWARLHGLTAAYDVFCAQQGLGRRSPREKIYRFAVDVVVRVNVTHASTSEDAESDGLERQGIVDAIRTLTAPELAAAIAEWSVRSIDPDQPPAPLR
ncbi:Uncharacterised protein [Mycobacteroides abscessus subsp. abscessus]|uniref:hypothetical protein n=1 Tax=Mycobacteroides abscessus TaxID=36809 RepID=UPI00092C5DDD|nr:hypothetical protein [Mycobacteroides abscessus]SHU73433.1 Uncharacterised protein [Mycobacteroides abscessus subsp. abscessus]